MARPHSSQHELRRHEILGVAVQRLADRGDPAPGSNGIAAAGGAYKARLHHGFIAMLGHGLVK